MKRDRNGEQSDPGAARVRWVNEYRASGLGLRQFAKRHGLRFGQLHYWVYQSPKVRVMKAPVPVFREVRLPAAALTPLPWSVEVALPDGTIVRLVRGTEETATMALVESLHRLCSSH